MKSIPVNGKHYPCEQTAGAMLRFKELTGKELTEIDMHSISELIKFLWCCVSSACSREGKTFEYSLMEFADSIGPKELEEWQKSLVEDNKGEGREEKESKKKKQKS